MGELQILSLNINGLNSPQKRKKTFNKLIRRNLDVIVIQETHIKEQHRQVLECPKMGKMFASLSQHKKRGVVIYIRESILAKQIYKDTEGRILVVEMTINQKRIIVVGIYAPNGGQEQFYRKLYNTLRAIDCENICIMGDFNAIIDRKLDYKSKEERKGPRRILPKVFFKMVDELGMRDIWRERNQGGSQYTYYSSRYKTWSRIDMVWVTTELLQEMGEVEIETNLWADHNPVRIRWRGEKNRQMDTKKSDYKKQRI